MITENEYYTAMMFKKYYKNMLKRLKAVKNSQKKDGVSTERVKELLEKHKERNKKYTKIIKEFELKDWSIKCKENPSLLCFEERAFMRTMGLKD